LTINRRQLVAGAASVAMAGALWSKEEGVADIADDGVLGLRQYTLRGGRRDTLISMFERRFLEPQNALGAHIIGTFRDLDDPDRLVWLRGFRDLSARQESFAGFYDGPAWRENRPSNNYPRLPVREHDRTFIWFARRPTVAAQEAFVARSSALSGWRDSAPDSMLPALMGKPEGLRLAPTERSALR
jgi:hypothetical protein